MTHVCCSWNIMRIQPCCLTPASELPRGLRPLRAATAAALPAQVLLNASASRRSHWAWHRPSKRAAQTSRLLSPQLQSGCCNRNASWHRLLSMHGRVQKKKIRGEILQSMTLTCSLTALHYRDTRCFAFSASLLQLVVPKTTAANNIMWHHVPTVIPATNPTSPC